MASVYFFIEVVGIWFKKLFLYKFFLFAMRKLAFLVLTVLVFASCTQDVTRNNPSLQGFKDDVLWRATDRYAELSQTGAITITGLTRYETLVIQLPSTNTGTYTLGDSEIKKAAYIFEKDDVNMTFQTGLNLGDGQVIIEEYNTDEQTITGTFRFNLVESETDSVVNYQNGVFYRVPVVPAL